MKYPRHVSTRRKCSVQCSISTHASKGMFPEFPKADFQDDKKILALLHYLKDSSLARFRAYLRVSLAARTNLPTSGLWDTFPKLVPLKVWNVHHQVSRRSLGTLASKATNIQME